MSQLKKELKWFLVAGFSAVGTDFAIYYFLSAWISYSLAKGISFLSGTIVAFGLNKYLTFKSHARMFDEGVKFTLLYLFTLCINIGSNFVCFNVFFHQKLLSFFIATAISTVINFIGQKMWVFR